MFTNKEVGKKNTELIDSLKNTEYPYVLPIWGDKATKAGFSLPYSAGLGVNYLWQESELVINNLNVGFNGSQKYLLDDIVRFNEATSRSNIVNFRPDVWLLPFLNVYGIFAKSSSSTFVDYSIYAPIGDGFEEIINLTSEAKFDGTSAGFGLTPTMGVGNGWIALDMNFTWTDIDALDKPAFSFVFGPRMGKSFKLKKPERNVAIWVGGFRVKLNSDTNGQLPLGDVLETEGINEKLDNGFIRLEEAQMKLDTWWAGLTSVEQKIYQGVYDRGNEAIGKVGGLLTGVSNAVDRLEDSTVEYTLDKKQKSLWNFLVGSQLQINKHWMIRAEAGFLGTRTQFLGGLQYRFGF
ncbi:hypothetical protein R9C00_02235 [Flammeovirgaceae bacterium SG7u.111]|nr:hypothetical protein [Flammeovirgaceae bacterium SG7u.132]WPO36261.1 hypothetical protein R9C00_02235 [Flammeovirgaceae bacterium SG7u.111]